MQDQRQQAAQAIQSANNILVTVSANPSVDQLAACIGLTLGLNKAGKHATAVFSGEVPDIIRFLNPEKTIEKNTDSLRDFIIALDKTKADKLRYKVEDKVVKIFITPYKTSIGEKDLEFSQGDFNVDVVLALGVHNQAELDQAITSHGRILHDASVVTMNVKPGGELGNVNWLEPASSLSELSVRLLDALNKELLDGSIATAMLTGIIAETERFSNALTTPQTMSISAELMAAGANQQLVATKLQALPTIERTVDREQSEKAESPKKDDGTLEISHSESKAPEAKEEKPESKPAESVEKIDHKPAEGSAEPEQKAEKKPEPSAKPEEPEEDKLPERKPEFVIEREPEEEPLAPQISIDDQGKLSTAEIDLKLPPANNQAQTTISHHNEPLKMVSQPPTPGQELLPEPEQSHFLANKSAPIKTEHKERIGGDNDEEPIITPEDEEKPAGGAPTGNSFLVGSQPGNSTQPGLAPFGQPQPPSPPLAPAHQPTIAELAQPQQFDQGPSPADMNRQVGATQGTMLPPMPSPQDAIPGSIPVAPGEHIDGTLVPSDSNDITNEVTAVPDVDRARDAVNQARSLMGGGSSAAPETTQPLGQPMMPAPDMVAPNAASPLPPPSMPPTPNSSSDWTQNFSATPSSPVAPGFGQAPQYQQAPAQLQQPQAPMPYQPVFPGVNNFSQPYQADSYNPAATQQATMQQQQVDPGAPPPVPPPMMPPAGQY